MNTEFTKNTIYETTLIVIQSGNYVLYDVYGHCFPFEYPLASAINDILKSQESVYSFRAGLPKKLCNKYRSECEGLFAAKLYRMRNKTIPTMLVYGDNVYDTHVPLELVFRPLAYRGPKNIAARNEGCMNCSFYGSYRGAFIALCCYCSMDYNGNYGILGFKGIDLYEMDKKQLQEAMPDHMRNTPLEDIGYTNKKADTCSVVSFIERRFPLDIKGEEYVDGYHGYSSDDYEYDTDDDSSAEMNYGDIENVDDNEQLHELTIPRVQIDTKDSQEKEIIADLDKTIATNEPSSIMSMSFQTIQKGKTALERILESEKECVYMEFGSEGADITYGLYKAKNTQIYLTRFSSHGMQKDQLEYIPIEQSVLVQ